MSAQPVVLVSDRVALPLTTPGVQVVRATRIQNTESIGVLLNRLLFNIAESAAQDNLFYVRLSYQGVPITNGWIPAISFCWPRTEGVEGSAAVGPSLPLALPIYLPPGDWIDVSFSAGLLNTDGAFTVTAAAHGVQSKLPPKEAWLPYFASFMGATRNVDTDGGTFSESSTPQDLGNPFDTDLRVERLIGRVLGTDVDSAYFTQATSVPWANFFLVSLSDSQDNLWIPQPTPIPNAFNVVSRSWKVNSVIPAKGYLRATIEGKKLTAAALAAYTYMRPLLGMVGYRRIVG